MSPISKLTDRANRETDRLRMSKRYRRYRQDPRTATWVLVIASILAIPAILWFGRDITFSGDELVWVSDTPYIDLTTIFTPTVATCWP
ncbi:MAG: hypothetical protein IPK93_03815 [Solirubrobacterales bacterium]|nr:hypothetical protein [Solirubrobacterales bacterium]